VIGGLLTILAITGMIGLWGYLGIVLLGTGFLKVCPAYSLLGFNTCRNRDS